MPSSVNRTLAACKRKKVLTASGTAPPYQPRPCQATIERSSSQKHGPRMTAEIKSNGSGPAANASAGPRSSRRRYLEFVRDYKLRKLDQEKEDNDEQPAESVENPDGKQQPADSRLRRREKRREFLYEYTRWLWPHRSAVAAVFISALAAAGL